MLWRHCPQPGRPHEIQTGPQPDHRLPITGHRPFSDAPVPARQRVSRAGEPRIFCGHRGTQPATIAGGRWVTGAGPVAACRRTSSNKQPDGGQDPLSCASTRASMPVYSQLVQQRFHRAIHQSATGQDKRPASARESRHASSDHSQATGTHTAQPAALHKPGPARLALTSASHSALNPAAVAAAGSGSLELEFGPSDRAGRGRSAVIVRLGAAQCFVLPAA